MKYPLLLGNGICQKRNSSEYAIKKESASMEWYIKYMQNMKTVIKQNDVLRKTCFLAK